MSQSTRQKGGFFGEERKYTRHLRPEDELSDADGDASDLLFMAAPQDHVPLVRSSKRSKLRNLPPTDASLYTDPTMDRSDMPAKPEEIYQFTQDITSKKFGNVLAKKCGLDAVDELFLATDAEETDHAAAASQLDSAVSSSSPTTAAPQPAPARKSKNKVRKEKRAQQRSMLHFESVPRVPARFDHFCYIRPDGRAAFRGREDVSECIHQLTPYLHRTAADWMEADCKPDDILEIGKQIGLFYLRTERNVEGRYTVHLFTDALQSGDSQVLTYEVLLFLVAGKLRGAACYFIHTYFFLYNDA